MGGGRHVQGGGGGYVQGGGGGYVQGWICQGGYVRRGWMDPYPLDMGPGIQRDTGGTHPTGMLSSY